MQRTQPLNFDDKLGKKFKCLVKNEKEVQFLLKVSESDCGTMLDSFE